MAVPDLHADTAAEFERSQPQTHILANGMHNVEVSKFINYSVNTRLVEKQKS